MREIKGVVQGFVESTDDKEGLGRVKLSFPWLDQSYQTEWVQIAWPMSGGSRGFFFSPEKGDEVLVGFDNGNFDHPYVIGFLHNGKQKPPEKERKNRVILTPGGHTLRFEDKDGEKKVILKSSDGLQVTLDDQKKSIELTGGGRILTMQNGIVKIS